MRLPAPTWLVLVALAGCQSPALRPTPPPGPEAGERPGAEDGVPPLVVPPGPLALLLTIEVQGFRSDAGLARVSLFESPEGFPEDHTRARRVAVGPIEQGACRFEWAGLEPGRYALAAIHDENENERLDRGLFGVPREGFAVSNDPPVRLGLPAFEEAVFQLEPPGRRLVLTLRYF